jgi:hypothetical protein
VGQGEVVLVVQSLLGQRVNVVNIQLSFTQEQINRFITDETFASLPVEQSLR